MLTSGLGSAVSGMDSSVISSPRTQISELLTPQAAPQPLPYCLFLLLNTSASSKANSGVSFSWKHLLNPSLSFQDESPLSPHCLVPQPLLSSLLCIATGPPCFPAGPPPGLLGLSAAAWSLILAPGVECVCVCVCVYPK